MQRDHLDLNEVPPSKPVGTYGDSGDFFFLHLCIDIWIVLLMYNSSEKWVGWLLPFVDGCFVFRKVIQFPSTSSGKQKLDDSGELLPLNFGRCINPIPQGQGYFFSSIHQKNISYGGTGLPYYNEGMEGWLVPNWFQNVPAGMGPPSMSLPLLRHDFLVLCHFQKLIMFFKVCTQALLIFFK